MAGLPIKHVLGGVGDKQLHQSQSRGGIWMSRALALRIS